MRSDMKDILITEGRRGSKYLKNQTVRRLRRSKIEDDETGRKIGMRPDKDDTDWDEYKCHQLGEHLTPLYKYLNSKVGEKWDDIWSEIKANNPSNSAVGAHIYTHIDIEKNPLFIDGYPHDPIAYGWGHRPLKKNNLYVDLEGYLRKAEGIKEKKKPTRIILYEIDDLTWAAKNKKDIWFLLKYSDEVREEERIEKIFYRYIEKEIEGKITKVSEYKERKYIRYHPILTEVYLKRDDFELLPKIHPDIFNYNKIGRNKYYLIEYKTLSKKDKKKYGIND